MIKYVPGDEITVKVDREGLEPEEGIAHLDDETMVVVVGAGRKVGETVDAIIAGVFQTRLGASILANAK